MDTKQQYAAITVLMLLAYIAYEFANFTAPAQMQNWIINNLAIMVSNDNDSSSDSCLLFRPVIELLELSSCILQTIFDHRNPCIPNILIQKNVF